MFTFSDSKTRPYMETSLLFVLLFSVVQLDYLQKCSDKPANKITQCRGPAYHWLWSATGPQLSIWTDCQTRAQCRLPRCHSTLTTISNKIAHVSLYNFIRMDINTLLYEQSSCGHSSILLMM